MANILSLQKKIRLLRAQEKFCYIQELLSTAEEMMKELYDNKIIRSFATTDYTLYVRISTQKFGSLIGKKSYMVKREDEECGYVFDDLKEAVELLVPHLLDIKEIEFPKLKTTIKKHQYELKLIYAGYEVKPVWYNFT